MSYQRAVVIMSMLCVFCFAPLCFAKPITLYDQPKTDAKTVGTLNSEEGMVVIFTPKPGDWVKVGDPNNGNVGWIKSSDLSNSAATAGGFSFTQKITNTGKGPETVIIQFGIPKKLTAEQTQALTKQIKLQQENIQKNIQNMMNDMYKSFDTFWTNNPIIMPVVVVPAPEKKIEAKQPTVPAKQQ